MSSSPTSFASSSQPPITDPGVLQIITDSHIQAPTACFVTAEDRVIAINELALRILGKEREEVVGHLAREFVGSSKERGLLPRVMSEFELIEGSDILDTDPIVKVAQIERTTLKVCWLQMPLLQGSRISDESDLSRDSTPKHYPSSLQRSPLRDSSVRGSLPRGSPLERLGSVGNHLLGNNVMRRIGEQEPEIQLVAMQVYEDTNQIHEVVRFAKSLEKNRLRITETGTSFITLNESVDNLKNILSQIFKEGTLNSYIAKVNLSPTSIWALDKNLSTDWTQVSYVISELLENACKYSGDKGKVILDIEYDAASEKLIIVIQDNGSGMDQDYLRDALEGKTFTVDATAPTSNPGITLRMCRLLVEDVLGGDFDGKTHCCGTEFKFSMKVQSMDTPLEDDMKPSSGSYPIRTSDIKLDTSTLGCAGESTPLSDSGSGAFKKLPTLKDKADTLLRTTRNRRMGYFQLPKIKPNLVPLKEFVRMGSIEELEDIPSARDKLSLDAPILHVDDERSGRMLLSRLMQQSKLSSIGEAGSGTDALEKTKQAIRSGKPYKMIFMDQMLGGDAPGLDKGNKVAEEIFKIYRELGLPLPIIIPASGNMNKEDIAIYEASGMSCELPLKKPFRVEQMQAIVKSYFTAS